MSCNLQVRACRSGWVCAERNDSNVGGASRKFALHANYVQILHKDNTVGCYMHFQQNGVTAQVGKAVRLNGRKRNKEEEKIKVRLNSALIAP